MMRPNLRQIEAFLAVAEAGNFSRAAAQIGMTQPGISQAVRDVEALLGLKLFDRTTRRVELTAAGHSFRVGALKSMEALDRAVIDVQDQTALRKGSLRLAAPPFLAATVLPQVLAAFKLLYPGLRLDLVDTSTAQIVAQVTGHHVDLGLGTFAADIENLGRRVVLHDDMMCFANDTFALPQRMRWADLAGLPIIVLSHASALRLPVDMGFEAAGLTLSPTFEVEQIATALALAKAGLGVAILPGYARAGYSKGVSAQVLESPTLRREVSLIYGNDRTQSPAATAFADQLTHSLRKLAPQD
jgi:DNA-binding transcriptional LysR family regulator